MSTSNATTYGLPAAVTVDGKPVSPLFFGAIASVNLDLSAINAGYNAMRDALRFGFDLEATVRQQHTLSICAGNYSRAAGAVGFLTTLLEQYEANGTFWTLDSSLDPQLAQFINMPAELRRSALALLPEHLEAAAVQVMCDLIAQVTSQNPPDFSSHKPEKAGSWPVRHGVAVRRHKPGQESKGQKSIPAVQHGRVIRN